MLEKKMALLQWRKMQNENTIKNVLQSSKVLLDRDLLTTLSVDSKAEHNQWTESIVRDELKRPLQVTYECNRTSRAELPCWSATRTERKISFPDHASSALPQVTDSFIKEYKDKEMKEQARYHAEAKQHIKSLKKLQTILRSKEEVKQRNSTFRQKQLIVRDELQSMA
jgi:hypothetical protein